MKGEKIKEILRAEGFKLSEVAELLGFDNDQRLHSALRSDDIKTGLLEDIARVTNRSVCLFYGTGTVCATVASDNSVAVTGSNNRVNSTEQTTYGDNSPAVKGNNNHFGTCSSIEKAFAAIDKTLDEVAAQRKLVEQALAQNATLISILQNQLLKA